MDHSLTRILEARDNQQLMDAVQSACTSLGESLRVCFFCRSEGPLLLQINYWSSRTSEERIVRASALARKLGGVTDGGDGILKLIEVPADFRCPGRNNSGAVVNGLCVMCTAVFDSR